MLPTIGRSVHYVDPFTGDHQAAIVTFVDYTGVSGAVQAVDLSVLGRYTIGHVHDIPLDADQKRPGSWHWAEVAHV